MLLWQTSGPQCLTHRFGETGSTVYACELPAEAKRWLKLQHSRGCSGGFVQPAELGECRGQLDVSDAVRGIGLDGFISRPARSLVAAAQQVAHRLCIVGGPCPRIEWAQSNTSFAPLDGAFGFAAPSQDDAAVNVGQGL